jgi:hypothetical protein
MSSWNTSQRKLAAGGWGSVRRWFAVVALMGAVAGGGLKSVAEETDTSPRQLYNDGTKKLQAGKLPEAEACLQGALASQDVKVQPPALYNLGSLRFREGAEDLKKGPKDGPARAAAQQASDHADSALQSADAALANDDVNELVSAYIQGRGARRELKAATAAVKAALESYGSVLAKWQRASGDFKSAHELASSDADAQSNAEAVDRTIARLVDLRQMMMQAMNGLAKKREELGKKLAKLKKKMPANAGKDMPGKGDDDDDDDGENGKKPPPEPKLGDKEPGNKNGTEMFLTPEEAARLLGMLKLDGDRKLPFGLGEGKPQDRKGRDW